MEKLKQDINSLIAAIEDITTLFYQNKIQEGYQNLDSLLLLLTNTIDQIYENKNNIPDFDEKELIDKLGNALKALEDKDIPLFSDMLLYEIGEFLKNVSDVLL